MNPRNDNAQKCTLSLRTMAINIIPIVFWPIKAVAFGIFALIVFGLTLLCLAFGTKAD